MTHAIRIDPKHFAVAGGFCPSCGARRDEFRPCGECGEERTWAQAMREAMERGDAIGVVNAKLAGAIEAQLFEPKEQAA